MTIEVKAAATGIDPVYICHGAEHDFTIAAGADSPWVNQGVSFNQVPGESFPITTDPELGKYQTFLTDGSKWKLHCPANGTDIDFNLQLQSEFTAAPCKVALKLGDYRRAILSKRDPVSAPLVGDIVAAEVQIGSFYTRKELEGIEVEWYYDGDIVQKVPTTGMGWSKFEHVVATAGEHTITAKVHSPYDDKKTEQSFTINVYVESPWEQATLTVNGNVVGWNEPILLLRGQASDVTVVAPPAIAGELNLGLVENGQLIIGASPKFDDWVARVDGRFNWKITPDADKSGRISLAFISREVLVPWEHRSLVISSNLADEVDQVLVGGVPSPADGAVFFRNEPQIVTLTYKQGSPLQDYPLELTGTPLTGVQPGNLTVTALGNNTWTVNSHTNSGTFKLKLSGADMTTGITLPVCKVMSRYLTEEADVKIDGVPVPLDGNVFFRGQAQVVTLTPKPLSPIAGYPVTLICTIISGLEAANVESAPEFDVEQTTHSWRVTGSTKSGTFQLSLAGKDMTRPITVAVSKLLSTNLADEATVLLDGDAIPPNGADFHGGKTKKLTLDYKDAKALIGVPLALDWIPDAGLVTGDLAAQPPFRQFSTQHEWTLTGAHLKSGTFKLKVFGEGESTALLTPTNRLHVGVTFRFIYATGHDIPLPPKMVGVSVNHWFACGVRLLESDGSPMVGVSITFIVPDHGTHSGETDSNGVATAAPFLYRTQGVRKIVAVAVLPAGNKTVEALVDVIGEWG